MIGKKAHSLAKELWPINRSLTGEGVRNTLKIIKKKNTRTTNSLSKDRKASFDWTVPKEWHVTEAWIKSPNGKKYVILKNNNLHLVGYSCPVHLKLSKEELIKIYTIPKMPNAIPYMTTYYKRDWGFLLN